ncbi:MAG TPA: hypothetical protein VFO65_06180 [Acidimicrobiales bacterium]|nr:hypothetical protein [Acidimicrobiales bacterium]
MTGRRPLRPLLPVRALVAVTVLLATLGCSPRPLSHAAPPAGAGERLAGALGVTRAAGSARFHARLDVEGAPPLDVRGVASLAGADAYGVASAGGPPATTVGPAEVLLAGGRAWVRPAGAPWTEVGVPALGEAAGSWAPLLAALDGAAGPVADRSGRRITARVDGDRVEVRLDGAGRIVRIERHSARARLVVELSDFGAEVPGAPP